MFSKNPNIENLRKRLEKHEVDGATKNEISRLLSTEMILTFVNDTFYDYDSKGVWKSTEENYIKMLIKRILGNQSTKHLINEILEFMKLDCYRDAGENVRPVNLINLKNGLLSLDTFKLISHTHDYFYVNQIPIAFDKGAQSPKWIKTINEIFEGDRDRINLLQELFGYILIPDAREEKAFFLIGTGQNGKGVITSVLTSIVGEGNYSTVTLNDLSKRFRLVEIKDKLLNIASETQTRLKLKDDTFKTVVSGEPIMGEMKYKQPFIFYPYARWVISMNSFPEILDKTEGTWRRIIIIEFNRYFSDEERDNNLKHYLVSKELPGILNWSIRGLDRFRKQGGVYVPKGIIETRNQYRKHNNPVHVFIDDKYDLVDINYSKKIRAEELYIKYSSWLSQNGHRGETNKEFGESLRITFIQIKKQRDSRGYYYLGLKPKA